MRNVVYDAHEIVAIPREETRHRIYREDAMMTNTDEARECFALFLAIGGSVIKMGDSGGYIQAGTAVCDDLAQTFDRLLSQGFLTLAVNRPTTTSVFAGCSWSQLSGPSGAGARVVGVSEPFRATG